ncbi:hypothetical protein C2G38_2037912 [Gigaspora rosea]|uniref:Uncharacterized protein n=1 Tax=Gigaspora rosea TaxID=44941 RepID=A0A397V5A4_9GLOM|nr:hypothetical protein C2G38_2037912 [Gigaspora rosea]
MFLRKQNSKDESNRGSQITNIHKRRKKYDKSTQLKSNEATKSINDNIIFDMPKDNQNSRNSLSPSESEMMSLLLTEVNKQLSMKVPSQTMEPTLDETGKAKEIKKYENNADSPNRIRNND